ncbi:alpha/beta fold hydrolase [Streptomyces sp. NPDC058319]|uniref:alpha/beta fold hydrolase n=1 Tax=unclassified Streptomyces TaxID=2593676 RepID=UPI0036E16592
MSDTHIQLHGGLAGDLHGDPDDPRPPLVLLHGLTSDRRLWGPLLAELPAGRRVLALDLPGHGGSPRSASYTPDAVAALLHRAVMAAGLDRPVLAGHSLGGLLATVYAAAHPVRGVVNIDQPLLPGPFGELLRGNEALLRGPDYLRLWDRLNAGMGIDTLPPAAQHLVRDVTTPRQDLLLGYWHDILTRSEDEIRERREQDLAALHTRGVPYRHVSAGEVPEPYRAWLRSVLPGAVFTVLPSAGHFPHLSHPRELAALIGERSAGSAGSEGSEG